jgi:site-specific recombinase XerC
MRERPHGFGKACEDAKVFNFHFHDLRHTFASRLAEAGVDAFTIAELMGALDFGDDQALRARDGRAQAQGSSCARPKEQGRKVVTIWSQKQKRQAG